MAWIAPRKVIESHFEEFIEKCKISKKDDKYIPHKSMFCVNEQIIRKKPLLIEKYKNWMSLTWVQDLISSTIDQFNDYGIAKPYVNAWLNQNTFTLYKFLSLYGPDKKCM